MNRSKSAKGVMGELTIAAKYIKKGFYVFNNISQHGPADMCVLDHDGYIMLVDVKAVSLRSKNGWKVNRVPTKKQKELDVQLIFVNLDTKEVMDVLPFRKDIKENDMTNVVPFEGKNVWRIYL